MYFSSITSASIQDTKDATYKSLNLSSRIICFRAITRACLAKKKKNTGANGTEMPAAFSGFSVSGNFRRLTCLFQYG